MSSMPPWMTRKVAGVPAWGWALAALAAVGFGLYLRRRAVATNSGSTSSDPTTLGDMANALAGGAASPTAAGLDPALADLLANAQMALVSAGQSASDAMMGGPAGYYDPGTGYDQGNGFDTGVVTNVASSGAGTVFDPSAGMIPMIGGWYSPGWNDPATQADLISIGTAYAAANPNWANPGGGGAAPLANRPARHRPASRPTPRPATRSSVRRAAAPKRSKPKAKAVAGWLRA